MPIVTLKPDLPPLADINTIPEAIQEPSKSIFNSLVPESKITSLLKYVEGFPWTVNYYGQILNVNNTIENFDPTTPNLTQPYYLINKLILQVSSPISSSYDSSNGITTITGSAIVPFGVIPNAGDVFVAQVDTGEDAIFHITTVSRKTHRKESLYEISYSLYSYTSANPTFLTSLEQKVNETYFFNNDTNFFNRDVLVKPSIKEATDRLNQYLEESQAHYLSTFPQVHTGSLLIPGINFKVYDPLLVNFISTIVPYNKLVEVNFFRHAFSSKYIEQPSIIDVITTKNKGLINNINKTFAFLPPNLLMNKARLGTAVYTGVDYILHPVTPNKKTDIKDSETIARTECISTIKTAKNYDTTTPIIVKTTNNNTVYNKPLLPELFVNDYYIVSENFYNYLNDNTLYNTISYFEFIISKHIKKEAIAKEDLVIIYESNYLNWPLLHQLYLLPILWLITKDNL